MRHFEIRHSTTYRYDRAVRLGPHRLLLRPRDSVEHKLISHKVSTWPQSAMQWSNDVYGNAVAAIVFDGSSEVLQIDSVAEVATSAPAWPVFNIAFSAAQYPFDYSHDDAADLGALLLQQYYDPHRRLSAWSRKFVRNHPTDTLALLKDINSAISGWVCYEARDAEGTQSPLQSLDRGRGSCRDFAVLFAEAVRTLGIGARIVSGYLCSSTQGTVGMSADGTTHAWAEAYLPGAGWIAFDPTNRTVGGSDLIAVAVGRDIGHVSPIAGTVSEGDGASAALRVSVKVTQT